MRSHFRLIIPAGLLLGVLAAAPAAAQDGATDFFAMDLAELTAVKVTVASHDSVDVFATPSTVTVVGRDMIERFGFQDLAEVLAHVAGLEVYQTIIDRNIPTARGVLQNFYANKILLLIDGVPTWQPIYGDGRLDRLDLEDVARIEVLKGPASVLYGSNAYAGVINLVLRRPEIGRGRAHARAGMPDLAAAGLNARVLAGGTDVFFSVNASSETRHPYTMTGVVGQPFNGSLEYRVTEVYETGNVNLSARRGDHSVLVNGFRYDHTYLGASPSYVSGGGQIVENRGLLASYRFDGPVGRGVRLRGSLNYDGFERRFPLSIDRTNTIRLAGSRVFADAVGMVDLSAGTRLETGLTVEERHSRGHKTWDAVQDTLVRDNMSGDDDVLEWSAYGQLHWTIGDLAVLLGTRYTDNDLFGDNVSSRVSAMYALGDRRSIKAMWGQSFRVPTMFELYFDHPTVIGNPALQPETSTCWELAYLAGSGRVFYQVLGFYADYEDLITRVTPPGGPPSAYVNGAAFAGRGIELELRYQGAGTAAFANWTLLDGVGDTADPNYRYVADHTVQAGVDQRIGAFSVGLLGKAVSAVDGHLERIPAQYLLDFNLGLRHEMGQVEVSHTLSLKNVTGSDMFIAEYIRQAPNVNALATTAYGRRLIYRVRIGF
jgi:outer membrane cobalamin receptor